MVEHPKSKSTEPSLRGDGPPCSIYRNLVALTDSISFRSDLTRGGGEHLAAVPVQQRQRLLPLPPTDPHRRRDAECDLVRGNLLGMVLGYHVCWGRLRLRNRICDRPPDPGLLTSFAVLMI